MDDKNKRGKKKKDETEERDENKEKEEEVQAEDDEKKERREELSGGSEASGTESKAESKEKGEEPVRAEDGNEDDGKSTMKVAEEVRTGSKDESMEKEEGEIKVDGEHKEDGGGEEMVPGRAETGRTESEDERVEEETEMDDGHKEEERMVPGISRETETESRNEIMEAEGEEVKAGDEHKEGSEEIEGEEVRADGEDKEDDGGEEMVPGRAEAGRTESEDERVEEETEMDDGDKKEERINEELPGISRETETESMNESMEAEGEEVKAGDEHKEDGGGEEMVSGRVEAGRTESKDERVVEEEEIEVDDDRKEEEGRNEEVKTGDEHKEGDRGEDMVAGSSKEGGTDGKAESREEGEEVVKVEDDEEEKKKMMMMTLGRKSSSSLDRSRWFSSNKNGSKEELAARETMRPRLCCSYRMLISFGGFLAFFNVTLIRLGTVMAMVCMSMPRSRNVTSNPDCPEIQFDAQNHLPEFVWSSTLQGIINSGGFYGFLVGPFLGGFLTFKFGGKFILLAGTLLAGFSQLFIPELTRIDPYYFFGIRIVSGFFGGWLFPSTFDILSRWSIPEERQLLIGGALIGVPTFSALNYPLNGMICRYMGWWWIFYINAIWLSACSAFIYFFIYDEPAKCPRAQREIAYIVPRTPARVTGLKVPWRKILSSIPVYAYIITHFCMNYGLITVLIHLPMFMREVHHFQLNSNSFLSASPYVGALFCRIITTFTFEKLRARLRMTKTALRKAFVFFGVTIPSVSLFVISFLSCRHRYITIAFFILFSITLELSFASGYLLSLTDMCPSYNNILSGIANAIANCAGLFSAVVTGFCTPNGSPDEWNRIFYISITFFIVAGFSYILFGTSELQPWGLVKQPGTDAAKTPNVVSGTSIP